MNAEAVRDAMSQCLQFLFQIVQEGKILENNNFSLDGDICCTDLFWWLEFSC